MNQGFTYGDSKKADKNELRVKVGAHFIGLLLASISLQYNAHPVNDNKSP